MTDQHGSIHPLGEAEAEKDLGVWVDNQLTFSVHVAKSAAKANSLLSLIHSSFKYLDKDNLPFIHKARPLIEYAHFGGLLQKHYKANSRKYNTEQPRWSR